ncbi:MAG: M20 family metallo-hydrolase [Bacteroidales bacterium]
MNNKTEYIELLKSIISTESFSRQEHKVAELIRAFMSKKSFEYHKHENNTWAYNKYYDEAKPTILLNSHIDTVKAGASWTINPFEAKESDGKLYGLGSNDAGGALVSLLSVFSHFHDANNLPFNLIYAATAEEEISGAKGITSILDKLPDIALAIVGEPTEMQMAIAEKGLVVIDGEAHGKSGHAARDEGVNALYLALDDIKTLREFSFPKSSDLLGEVKISVTQIEAGRNHNVVPDLCKFVIDVRTNEHYTNQEVLDILQTQVKSDLKARSLRLNSSSIELEHPIVKRGLSLGMSYYGSPTLSDQALLPFQSIKLGPGHSSRSHTADEYIYMSEIYDAIDKYISIIDNLAVSGYTRKKRI